MGSLNNSCLPTSNTLQLLIAELKWLFCLVLKPIILVDIKPCLLCQGNRRLKVGSTLEFLL